MRTIKEMLNISSRRERIRGTLWASIQARRIIEFYYHGGYRTVEPFALGITKSGKADNESLMCYQISGYSELREAIGWKLYRISEMEDMSVSHQEFSGDRPGYDPNQIDMVKIYCCVSLEKKTGDKAVPEAQPKIRAAPLPDYGPYHKPLVKYLTHHELMRRFRFTHPVPVKEIFTVIFPRTPARTPPESVGLKSVPLAQLMA